MNCDRVYFSGLKPITYKNTFLGKKDISSAWHWNAQSFLTHTEQPWINHSGFTFFFLPVLQSGQQKSCPRYRAAPQILKLSTHFASVHSFFPFDLTKLLKLWIEAFERMFPLQDRVKMHDCREERESLRQRKTGGLSGTSLQTKPRFSFSP